MTNIAGKRDEKGDQKARNLDVVYKPYVMDCNGIYNGMEWHVMVCKGM